MTSSTKAVGRLAGFVYLVVAVTGAFNLLYVPSQLIVMSDPAATLSNLTASATLFKLGIVSGMVSNIAFLALPIILYQLLEPFGRIWSALMVTFATVSVAIFFINIQHHLAIVSLLNGGSSVGDVAANQLAAQVMQHLKTHQLGGSINAIFWGLWLLPLGYLVLKSGVMPRFLGLLLLLGCAGYLVNFFIPLFFAHYEKTRLPSYVVMPGGFGEIGTCLWLLIKGANEKPTGTWL